MVYHNLKTNKYSYVSITLSIICCISIIIINHDIAKSYLLTDGKGRVLFGLTELLIYYYQYYFVLLSLVAFVFAIIGSRKKECGNINRLSYLIGIVSLIFIFARIWRLMI